MKKLLVFGVCVTVLGCLLGCEWSSSGDGDSWSDSYNWVNFSGTYRNSLGGVLVTDYTTTPSTPGSTNKFKGTGKSTLPKNASSAHGNTGKNQPVVPGTFSLTISGTDGSITMKDDGTGALVSSGGGGSGTITTSGAWDFTLAAGFAVPEARSITFSYEYIVVNDGTSGSGITSGASGKTVYSFNIVHQGQNLTFTDNNGAVYTGYISSMNSSSGASNNGAGLPENGDTVIATFKCSGNSAAGMHVTITGTLQGTVSGGVFTGRTITGTWIEGGGKTGDINGQTAAVTITVNTDEPAE